MLAMTFAIQTDECSCSMPDAPNRVIRNETSKANSSDRALNEQHSKSYNDCKVKDKLVKRNSPAYVPLRSSYTSRGKLNSKGEVNEKYKFSKFQPQRGGKRKNIRYLSSNPIGEANENLICSARSLWTYIYEAWPRAFLYNTWADETWQ